MDYEKKIDIPFGAHDSELKGWEYTIPEGMEAIIKDGKVIVREKESDGDRIRKYLIEELKAAKSVGELKFVIPQPTREECISYLEKMKEANKAIEVVGRIDKHIKYIRAYTYTANAYDMDDSNPDKKYYIGVDDTLSKIAGILNGVYSEKDNKFAPRVLPCSAAWFEDGEEKQEEQKPLSTEETELNSIAFLEQMGYLCIPPGKELKPAEWGEKEKENLDKCCAVIAQPDTFFDTYFRQKCLDFLFEISKKFSLPPKQEWSEEDENNLNKLLQWDGIPLGLRSWVSGLPEKVGTRPSWKPSEEQIAALNYAYCRLFKSEYVGHNILGPLQKLCDELAKL